MIPALPGVKPSSLKQLEAPFLLFLSRFLSPCLALPSPFPPRYHHHHDCNQCHHHHYHHHHHHKHHHITTTIITIVTINIITITVSSASLTPSTKASLAMWQNISISRRMLPGPSSGISKKGASDISIPHQT